MPVVGLVTIGTHAYADRYTYVPTIGLFIALAWLTPRLRTIAPAVLIVLAALCFVQVGYWRNTLTLFNHVLEVQPNNYRAHLNIGIVYLFTDDPDSAEQHLRRATQINPRRAEPHLLLGNIYRQRDQIESAIAAFTQAMIRDPDNPIVREQLLELRQDQARRLNIPANPDRLPPP